jgi:hypothetical protein
MNVHFVAFDPKIPGTTYAQLIVRLESEPHYVDVLESGYCLASELSARELHDELSAIVGDDDAIVVLPLADGDRAVPDSLAESVSRLHQQAERRPVTR